MDRLEGTHLSLMILGVDLSWLRPRGSLGGTFSGGAMVEETRDVMMIWLGDRVH